MENPLARLDQVEKHFGVTLRGGADIANTLQRSFDTAEALVELQQFFANVEIQSKIAPLIGTNLGFLTDKDTKGGYKPDIISNCICEAFLQGLHITGNEFNIIAGKMYATKNGKFRLIIETQGLTNFKYTSQPPERANGVANIDCEAEWEMNGKDQYFSVTIPVRIQKDKYGNETKDDNLIGKASSKLFSRVLERLKGICMPEAEDIILGGPMKVIQKEEISTSDAFDDPDAENHPSQEQSEPIEANAVTEQADQTQKIEPEPDSPLAMLSSFYQLKIIDKETRLTVKNLENAENYTAIKQMYESIIEGMDELTFKKAKMIGQARLVGEEAERKAIFNAVFQADSLERLGKIEEGMQPGQQSTKNQPVDF